MTSKEALTKIDCLLSDYVCRLKPENSLYCEDDDGSKYIDTIEKDLEVLEMLKTYFKVNGFDELVPNDYWYDLPFEDRNKIYKLYEELENDR